ncbi:hypothetical protein F5Y06DRAFT_302552 [Hypoxylon sp. FL0890]|nr:hypothetical protein F5Y06DRAFT_302552 [Hypoxylon sp. FL0890]
MMGAMSQYHGSLVAFEGPRDTISTQLRLLPNSPNILIIPPLQSFMKEANSRAPFDAQSYVLSVHKACSERAEIARTFLRDSTPSNKRLVFMNGGTASAHMECISNISKNMTAGDLKRAERIFSRLARNGVAGLHCPPKTGTDFKPSQIETANQNSNEHGGEMASDPVSDAMRAADALDLQTAFLQTNNEIDLTTSTRRRSTSVPIYRVADDIQNAAPFYIFGARKWQRSSDHGLELPQSPRRSYTTHDSRKAPRLALTPAGSRINELNSPLSRMSHERGVSRKQLSPATSDLPSPRTFEFKSTPNTPAICEAFAVDIRPSASTASHKKIKSDDRIYCTEIRNQDILLCSFPEPPCSRPQSAVNSPIAHQPKSPLRSKFSCEIPRPTFSTPSRSTVRRNPPSPLILHKPLWRPATYVDRGTNPMNTYVDQGTTTEPEPILLPQEADAEDNVSLNFEDSLDFDSNEPHETVLPIIENLVILFKAEKPDRRLEAMVQAFREGKYPVSMSFSVTEAEGNSNQSSTPNSREQRVMPLSNKRPISYIHHAEVTPAHHIDSDDYDPFAYGKYLPPSKNNTNGHMPSTPPTPAQTPPLTARKPERGFHDFTTTDCRTAVSMQNSLRSILKIYFPPEDTGYHQFNFPLLPELSSLWKPVFRESDSGTVKHRKRKVDLILAIGAQRGVEKDFVAAISGSLEKLGTKPNGVTRSGKLDLRFLIASAMQAFTAQPLANQTQDNPFSNPLLLATLIIPHLETYMAAHSATRFLLLEYPPEHLATVLALQRLVGVDLLKIAGILYSEDNDSKMYPGMKISPRKNTHLHMRSNSGISRISTRTGATLVTPPGVKQAETPSFSKANFLITSSANESEIATLISTIWKILVEISTFYIPEGMAPKASVQIDGELKRDSKRESHGRPLAQTPLINPTQQYAPLANAADIMGFDKMASNGETYTDANPPPLPPKNRDREPTRREALKSSKGSISETIRSSRTARTMRSQRKKLRNVLGRETDADSVAARVDTASVYQDCWDDDDYGFADEERKYMPLYGRTGGPRKGNSRKALKWLGLAT